MNQWSQKALLRDIHKRRAHTSSQILLTEWRACYTIRHQTLRHFWRRMRPRELAIRCAERQVISSRISNLIQSCFEKWMFVVINIIRRRQAISVRITMKIQSHIGLWSSAQTIMGVIISKWRVHSRIRTKIYEFNDSQEPFVPPIDADPVVIPPVDADLAMALELQKALAHSRKNKLIKPENEEKNEKRRQSKQEFGKKMFNLTGILIDGAKEKQEIQAQQTAAIKQQKIENTI